ncbi:hypothetical protein [Massilistercora timonensis]|uniref:YkvI family membrane protein n=1 Tax=Massilistercora timonensis TaxID=2086584 RepID=UPI003AB40C0C
MKKSRKTLRIIINMGVYFSAVVGAGFASGQEIMQFFTNFGVSSLWAVIPVTIFFGALGWLCIELGHRMHTDSHSPIIQATCGKWLGKIIDWVITFFMFGCFALMVSGGGTTLADYFGMNPIVGRILTAAITVLVVILGFQIISFFNGIIGPVIIVSVLVVSLIAIFRSTDGIGNVAGILETADVYRSAPNIIISLFLYVAFCVTGNMATLAGIGNREEDASVRKYSGWAGGLALGLCILFINYTLLKNYENIYESSIPLVELAVQIYRPLGIFFAVILLLGILSSAVSFLFGTVTRFTEYGTRHSKVLACILGIVAVLSGMVPFERLVNTLYPLLGYVGLIVMLGSTYYVIKNRKRTIEKK